jgi:hypothetical protein
MKQMQKGHPSELNPFKKPAWFADRSMRLAVMAKFKALPIFGA